MILSPLHASGSRPWHTQPGHVVQEALGTGEGGLTAEEAARRLAELGPNELAERKSVPSWRRLLNQFNSPLIYVLLVAALLSFFVGHRWDPYVILAIVAVNAVIGYFQESRAEQALAALRRMTAPQAKVVRDGHVRALPAREVVPGDLVVLETGDRVTADARLLEASELSVDESALTGESLPVSKSPEPLAEPELPLGDRTSMVYMNTHVTAGKARALVVATGMATEMGAIAREVSTVEAPSPLQRQLAAFSRTLGFLTLGIVGVVLVLGLMRGLALAEMVVVALSMAVSAIPEGLPIVVSVLLAVGVWRMARRRALIRNLPAVEALGSATVICTDKTGTLTQNQMTVQRLYAGGAWARVTGEGYRPLGDLVPEGPAIHPDTLRAVLAGAALCNDALVEDTPEGWQVVGDPTEGALQTLAMKGGFTETWPRLAEIPFSSERQWMATLHRRPDGVRVALLKGAPEVLLELSGHMLDGEGRRRPLADADRRAWKEASRAMASEAMRVLAIGCILEPSCGDEDFWCLPLAGEVTLAGLVGMIDPPRPEAVAAIETARTAGIRVVMITGDHRATAEAIARRMGLVSAQEAEVVQGADLERLDEATLTERLRRIRVFARVSPAHKLRIVRALQAEGQIVAMTGDGVNDAPALSQADIGVAMGLTGTEVAKGAADMILADDNFATIVSAIEEGRTIADNLRKAIQYLLTTNANELLTVLLAVNVGLPIPFAAVQILWINLVTDGTLDKAFAFEPRDPAVMRRPPRRPGAPLFTRPMAIRLFLSASLMAGGTLALYAWQLSHGVPLERARTMAFMTNVAFQWMSAFTFRSFGHNLWQLSANRWMWLGLGVSVLLQALVLYVPAMQAVMQTVPLTPGELALAVSMGSTVLLAGELYKYLMQRMQTKRRSHA